MKITVSVRPSQQAREVEVPDEIRSFLKAVASYPERVAREPQVSFEAHCSSVYAEEAGRVSNFQVGQQGTSL
ncbi:MAG TPA: hypothetical protein VE083_09400 [Terriglobales bacterium]|nr:hypothetical protein [Terriglobales bacterium]